MQRIGTWSPSCLGCQPPERRRNGPTVRLSQRRLIYSCTAADCTRKWKSYDPNVLKLEEAVVHTSPLFTVNYYTACIFKVHDNIKVHWLQSKSTKQWAPFEQDSEMCLRIND